MIERKSDGYEGFVLPVDVNDTGNDENGAKEDIRRKVFAEKQNIVDEG